MRTPRIKGFRRMQNDLYDAIELVANFLTAPDPLVFASVYKSLGFHMTEDGPEEDFALARRASKLHRAWMVIYIVSKVEQELCKKRRVFGNFGIACGTDLESVKYQQYDRRYQRSRLSLSAWPGIPTQELIFDGVVDEAGNLVWKDITNTNIEPFWRQWKEEARKIGELITMHNLTRKDFAAKGTKLV